VAVPSASARASPGGRGQSDIGPGRERDLEGLAPQGRPELVVDDLDDLLGRAERVMEVGPEALLLDRATKFLATTRLTSARAGRPGSPGRPGRCPARSPPTAERLNALGYRPRRASRWTQWSIRRLLLAPYLSGRWSYGSRARKNRSSDGAAIDLEIPAVLSEERHAQLLTASRPPASPGGRAARSSARTAGRRCTPVRY